MNYNHLLLNRIIPGAAGGATALLLSRMHPSLEDLVGYSAVLVLAAIMALEYGFTGRKLS